MLEFSPPPCNSCPARSAGCVGGQLRNSQSCIDTYERIMGKIMYPEVVARCLTKAITYLDDKSDLEKELINCNDDKTILEYLVGKFQDLLDDSEGIIVQVENEDGRLEKFALWIKDDQAIINSIKDGEDGLLLMVCDTKEDAITNAALNGFEILEL